LPPRRFAWVRAAGHGANRLSPSQPVVRGPGVPEDSFRSDPQEGFSGAADHAHLAPGLVVDVNRRDEAVEKANFEIGNPDRFDEHGSEVTVALERFPGPGQSNGLVAEPSLDRPLSSPSAPKTDPRIEPRPTPTPAYQSPSRRPFGTEIPRSGGVASGGITHHVTDLRAQVCLNAPISQSEERFSVRSEDDQRFVRVIRGNQRRLSYLYDAKGDAARIRLDAAEYGQRVESSLFVSGCRRDDNEKSGGPQGRRCTSSQFSEATTEPKRPLRSPGFAPPTIRRGRGRRRCKWSRTLGVHDSSKES
jgi:hypothetical protein